MRKLISFILILSQAQAAVLDLGTIDSNPGLLGERFTLSVTEEDQKRAISMFFLEKQSTFMNILTVPELVVKDPKSVDEGWMNLIGVDHD